MSLGQFANFGGADSLSRGYLGAFLKERSIRLHFKAILGRLVCRSVLPNTTPLGLLAFQRIVSALRPWHRGQGAFGFLYIYYNMLHFSPQFLPLADFVGFSA